MNKQMHTSPAPRPVVITQARTRITKQTRFHLLLALALALGAVLLAGGVVSAQPFRDPPLQGTPTPTSTVTPAATPTCSPNDTYRILLTYADGGTPGRLQYALLLQPGVGTVDLFNAGTGTPSLSLLQQYNLVFTYSNTPYADSATLGNNLADYQDGGGLVVVNFGSFYNAAGYYLGGRWQSDGYSPYAYSTTLLGTATTLGTYDPLHPLMQGVTMLNSLDRLNSPLAGGATQVAVYSDASAAVAYKANNGHTAVGLTAYIGDNGPRGVGDYATIIVNVARWLAPGTPCASATPPRTATGTPPTTTPTRTATTTPTTTPTATVTPPPTNPPTATVTITPTPGLGSISGTIYANSITSTNVLSGAYVFACKAGVFCTALARTGADGHYAIGSLPPGTEYYVTANPPDGSSLVPNRIGPLVLPPGGHLIQQNNVLSNSVPLPAGVTLEPRLDFTANGVPVWHWGQPLTLRVPGCPGGTATYQIFQNGAVVRGLPPLPLTEAPLGSGIYLATVDPLQPLHGAVQIVVTLHCPGGILYYVYIDGYIDPSGYVRTTDGAPIPGASVTLYRADAPTGPFTLVPDGSGLLSPMNRQNPDTTDAGGHFGWDVVAGYYQVRAERVGCHAPGNPAQPSIFSAILPIPPPVTDLDLRLECPGLSFTDMPASQPFYRYTHWMGTWGYISGYGCGGPGEPCDADRHTYFRPYASATRSQFAKMLGNALRWTDAIPADQQTFADVPANQPFWLFVERAAAQGAISGYGCGGLGEPCDAARRPYFRPAVNITRSQLAKILAGALPLVAVIPPTQQTFADVPAGHPFWRGVEQAAGRGLISGYGCGGPGEPCDAARRPYFRPYGTATRGQISKMITLALAQP